MKITTEQVQHAAHLARIEMSADEQAVFQAQLDQILTYMEKLNEVDTTQVEPMLSVMGLHNVFRHDQVRPSLPREEALLNAPDKGEDSYKVPAILD